MSMKVGIIGAGIAGLCAAIALRRAGHEVEVFEQSEFKNEVGAAITITPNGVIVLKKWGFDFEGTQAVEGKQMRLHNYKTLAKTVDDPWLDFEECYGNKTFLFHRSDLHQGLREMAEAPGDKAIPGEPVKIRLGCAVAQVDVEEGTITLADGTHLKKDFLVIADGVKSRFASAITGKDEPLFPLGRSVFRCLIPFEKVYEDEELATFFKGEGHGWWIPCNPTAWTFVVSYPCRGGKYLNIGLLHKSRGQTAAAGDWHASATLESALEVLENFHPAIHRLICMAPEVKLFTLHARDPLDTLWRGRAVIIGDAAHPMAPTHAQAGVLALEEGAALEILFEGVTDFPTIKTHLKAYSEYMRPLCTRAQMLSSYPVHSNPEAMRKLRNIYKGPLPKAELSFDRSYKDLFYPHNILKEMKKIRDDLDIITSSQTPSDSHLGESLAVSVKLSFAESDDFSIPSGPCKEQTEHQSLTKLAANIVTAATSLQTELARISAPTPSLSDVNGPKALPVIPEIQTAKLQLQQALLDLNLLVTGPTEFFMANCLQWNYDKACIDVLNRFNFWDSVPLTGCATYTKIAQNVGLPESIVRRLFRHAFSLRVFAEHPPGADTVVHTNFSSLPVRDPNVRSWIAHHAEEGGPSAVNLAPALAKWGEGLTPGQTAAGHTLFPQDDTKSFWDWLATEGESDGKKGWRQKRFGDAMAFTANSPGMGMKASLAAFDWSQLGKATLIDIGGSAGHVAFHLASLLPDLTCVVQDLPGLEEKFNAARPPALADRVSFVAHDFFTPQPIKGDIYFLRKIVHDWSDAYALEILKQIVPAMKPGSRILISEAVAPPTGGGSEFPTESAAPSSVSRIVTALDLHMMTTLSGKERSAAEFAGLIKEADERLIVKGIHRSIGNAYALIEVVFKE